MTDTDANRLNVTIYFKPGAGSLKIVRFNCIMDQDEFDRLIHDRIAGEAEGRYDMIIDDEERTVTIILSEIVMLGR